MTIAQEIATKLAPGTILRGPLLAEPIMVIASAPVGDSSRSFHLLVTTDHLSRAHETI